MRKEFLVSRQGKTFALYAGLLEEAHNAGLLSIITTLIQAPCEANNRVAIVSATVSMEDGKVFTGLGDAAPNNVAPVMQTCLLRMAECVPLRAKILTLAGWKHHDELTIGEMVLAYDVDTDTCTWTQLQAVSTFNDAHTATLKGRSFYTECTLAHTWAVANQRCVRKLVRFCDLTKNSRIVVAAKTEWCGSLPVSARDAAILGWLVTDGSIRWHPVAGKDYQRFTIYQSKPEQLQIIRELLGEDASESRAEPYERTFPTGKTYQCRESFKFELKSAFGRGLMERTGFTCYLELPKLVTRLSNEARAAMLNAMLLADGSKNTSSLGWTFAKKSHEGVMEAFEILATLEGYALGAPRLIKSCNMPSRAMRSNRHINLSYLQHGDTKKQDVWCPTTKYGTWVMNLDGYITITGNTRAKARALRDAINIGVCSVEELGGDGGGADNEDYVETNRPQRAFRPGQATSNAGVNNADAPCPECHAPAGKPHASSCRERNG